jgi:hypothetical protein
MVSIIMFLFIELFQDHTPDNVKKLMQYYPQIVRYENNLLHFTDGSTMIYDDHKKKKKSELLTNPDIEDMFYYTYSKNENKRSDAGRIRNEKFFRKIYGETKEVVLKNLKSVQWNDDNANQKIWVNSVNNFDEIIRKLSQELNQNNTFQKYLTNLGGTYNWRFIAGTQRLSSHSFGITIDINTKYSSYWQWDCKCSDEEVKLKYRNEIPLELVEIFEKYGFIWGGRWEHYDTMHFEYRPELVLE